MKRVWAVNTGVNDISLDGTKVVAQVDYEHGMQGPCRILDTETNKQRGEILKAATNEEADMGRFFMTYYNWTYASTANGPSEKLLTTGSDCVNVFDPQTGKHLALLKYLDDANVFLRLTAVSHDNRTLVFSDDLVMTSSVANTIVWHFY